MLKNFMIFSPCIYFIRILELAASLPALRNGCEFPLYYNVERRSAKSTSTVSFLKVFVKDSRKSAGDLDLALPARVSSSGCPRLVYLHLGLGVGFALKACADGRHTPHVSGFQLFPVPLKIRDKCPVFTTRTRSPKANHARHVGAELTLNYGSHLERRTLGRVASRPYLSPARASKRAAALCFGGGISGAQSRARSRQPMVPARIGKRNGDHHQDQKDRNNTKCLKG
jgi:hypothetical protein